MKKILLTISVICCCTGIAVAQDGKKVEKKKANPTPLYNSQTINAARLKEKDAKVKAFEAGKVQTTNQSSKASLAVDRAN